ncbi:universal stress protein [Streptomyces sp. NBC_00005]|uniref:universal stress protein n=1 Tax=Streptomyces sp. NBC_00005 TaxID=2903609 RepID=UPI0032480F90
MRAATGPVGSLDLALDRLRSRHPCPDIHARLLKAPPYEALLTSGGDAELLVLGSRGVGGMSALLLGSTGAETATRADFPVTLVRPVPHSGDMPAGPVLLALDTERRPQDAVIGFAFEGAAMRKASLRALYVRDLVTRILAPGTPPERRVDAVMTGSPPRSRPTPAS